MLSESDTERHTQNETLKDREGQRQGDRERGRAWQSLGDREGMGHRKKGTVTKTVPEKDQRQTGREILRTGQGSEETDRDR